MKGQLGAKRELEEAETYPSIEMSLSEPPKYCEYKRAIGSP